MIVVPACLNLTDSAEFTTNLQAETINNISAQSVTTGHNYGLLHLDYCTLLLPLILQ